MSFPIAAQVFSRPPPTVEPDGGVAMLRDAAQTLAEREALLWVAGGLLILLAARAAILRRRVRRRPCRWRREEGAGPRAAATWRCRGCGAEVFTLDGRPPHGCKRSLGMSSL